MLTNAAGPHPVLVRAGHQRQVGLQRLVRGLLAAGAGPLKAGPGVTGTLATITRADGSTQETYDGHPLYTYVGDSGPGQDHGNNLNLNGGLWHVVPVSRLARPAVRRRLPVVDELDRDIQVLALEQAPGPPGARPSSWTRPAARRPGPGP